MAVVHTGSDLRIGSSNTVSYGSNRFYPVPFHNIRTLRGLQLQRAPAVSIPELTFSRGSSLANRLGLWMRPLFGHPMLFLHTQSVLVAVQHNTLKWMPRNELR